MKETPLQMGLDASGVFEDVGHSKMARGIMLRYVIGRVAPLFSRSASDDSGIGREVTQNCGFARRDSLPATGSLMAAAAAGSPTVGGAI